MIKGLLERNIPTVAVVIGDSSNGLSANNTLKTLATLQVIATRESKPLSMIYVNNARVNDKNIILLKLTPIDLSFFNHLDSIPFSSNVNSLYEILNGLRKSFIENNKAN
jgi:hypothetical protein